MRRKKNETGDRGALVEVGGQKGEVRRRRTRSFRESSSKLLRNAKVWIHHGLFYNILLSTKTRVHHFFRLSF